MNIPKIRFKGFEDTWKNDKIGNIGSVLMCKRIFKSQTTSIGDIPFIKSVLSVQQQMLLSLKIYLMNIKQDLVIHNMGIFYYLQLELLVE